MLLDNSHLQPKTIKVGLVNQEPTFFNHHYQILDAPGVEFPPADIYSPNYSDHRGQATLSMSL